MRIDSPDVGALRRPRLRTRLLQIVFSGLAVALLLAAAANARDLDTRDPGLLPRGTTGVVVVDLSLSITDADYAAVRRALRELAADDARIGLVVFSDVAYELLPPGTPARELRPMLRLLVPRGGPAPNPWTQSFRAGTRISTALGLAAEMLERDEIENPSILLVSDLETAPDDVPVLARTIVSLRARSIPLEVSGLGPSSDARKLFGGLLEEGALTVSRDSGATARSPGAVGRLPTELLVLGALLFAALAVHERFTARLGLPAAARVGGSA
ncbi:MAG: vWA domain-containing protein [Gaiellaceae bacterium]